MKVDPYLTPNKSRQLRKGRKGKSSLLKEQCSQFTDSLPIERDFPAESPIDLPNWGERPNIHVNSKLALDNGTYFLLHITGSGRL